MIANLIDAILIALTDCVVMYAFWVIGMAAGVLDATPEHWAQILCTAPLFLLDGLIVVAAPAAMLYLNSVGAFPEATSTLANAFFISIICVNWLYHAVFESSPARGTPGKIFMEIAVVQPRRGSVSFTAATIRHFAKILSAITFFVPLFDKEKRSCLHDKVSGSNVISEQA
jgi:uncharacterized RDD family membrane protein YckC